MCVVFFVCIYSDIARLRKQLRGVNAVHENDVAVAHCSSIMQHRLTKAEEEYMKMLTAQVGVKRDVDTLRREILSLRKVHAALESDIAHVHHASATLEDKIKAAKSVRGAVANELDELLRRAELEAEERKLKLQTPESDATVDVEKLMKAVGERNHARLKRLGESAAMAAAAAAASSSSTKPTGASGTSLGGPGASSASSLSGSAAKGAKAGSGLTFRVRGGVHTYSCYG